MSSTTITTSPPPSAAPSVGVTTAGFPAVTTTADNTAPAAVVYTPE